MADDWEDWEDESFQAPPLAGTSGATNGQFETKGQEVLARAKEPDASKFEGEDAEEDTPEWQKSVPQPQQKKQAEKKLYEDKGRSAAEEGPLDDPIAEKLRQQRLVEEADLESARDLFGTEGEGAAPHPDALQPKSAKDFEDFARAVAAKYLAPHARSPHYKGLCKALTKHALGPLDVASVKDVEASIAGLRADKVKQDNADKAAKKQVGKKKTLNVGRSGGTAGLDDYVFNDALDDEVDFM